MRFTIVSTGALRAAFRIRGLGEQAANCRPAMEEIYMMILEIEDEIFESGGARGGRQEWHPLSHDWLTSKWNRGKNVFVLQEDGTLRDSVTRWRHPLQYTRIERSKIVFRSQRPFADLHQKGEGGMPKREFIYFTKLDAERFAQQIKQHVMSRRAGGPSLAAG
jgi:phage gpG-like protein